MRLTDMLRAIATTGNGESPATPLEAPYEPHPDDHACLLHPCPVCPAAIGAWCGGINDVHSERAALVEKE